MSFKINLDSLFDGSLGFDLRDREEYKIRLETCLKASEKLILEIKNRSNEITNSFSYEYQKKIKSLKNKMNVKKNKLVIGLGGSSSGAKAISMYLGDNVFFFDNYDPQYIDLFFKKNNIEDFTIYVISKSGNTFETLAMLNLTFQHLLSINKQAEVVKNIYVITEDNDNLLNNFAKKNNISLIPHNKKIGGRYSVFSETGMILFECNPFQVSNSANSIIDYLNKNLLDDHMNPTVNAAVILALKDINNINFNVNLLYDYSLKNYSYWFHQLFAESLGKGNNAITPMTSICPKDHHSMMQLYLDGPKDKLFNIYLPLDNSYFDSFSPLELGEIEKKNPKTLLKSQCLGLIKSFKDQKIPHRIINCSSNPEERENNIFGLFAFNILETIILGYAQDLNPYNQPAVEQIKVNTFTL